MFKKGDRVRILSDGRGDLIWWQKELIGDTGIVEAVNRNIIQVRFNYRFCSFARHQLEINTDMEFKKGDRVKVLASSSPSLPNHIKAGKKGDVDRIVKSAVHVKFKDGSVFPFLPSLLKRCNNSQTHLKFDLDKAKAGAVVVTREHKIVSQLRHLTNKNLSKGYLSADIEGYAIPAVCDLDGVSYVTASGVESRCDLFLLEGKYKPI